MTREEAIAFLKQVENILLHNNSWLESTHNPIKESFEMAIEALKEEKVHLICPHCLKDMYYTKVTHTIELGGEAE